MQTTLTALAVITVGYIFAYLLFDRLRDRYGYVGGAEYVVIGFLLGPRVTGLLDASQVQDLTPIVSLALVAFGLVLAVVHQGEVAPGVRPPTATEWAVINLAVGVASGVLFHLFLGPRGHLDQGRLFVALAGAIVVASGASYYLNLSPIFTNLVLGVILVNSGGAHRDVARLLLSTERPVYLALLLFAGAAWSSGPVDLLFIAPLFVLIFEIVASKEASAFILGLESRVREMEVGEDSDSEALEPVPGPG